MEIMEWVNGEGKTIVVSAKEAVDLYTAVKEALRAQDAFEDSMKQKGAEILSKVQPGQKLFVLVSRPYNGCDEGLNLELPKKMTEHGVDIIPMDMLDLKLLLTRK